MSIYCIRVLSVKTDELITFYYCCCIVYAVCIRSSYSSSSSRCVAVPSTRTQCVCSSAKSRSRYTIQTPAHGSGTLWKVLLLLVRDRRRVLEIIYIPLTILPYLAGPHHFWQSATCRTKAVNVVKISWMYRMANDTNTAEYCKYWGLPYV